MAAQNQYLSSFTKQSSFRAAPHCTSLSPVSTPQNTLFSPKLGVRLGVVRLERVIIGVDLPISQCLWVGSVDTCNILDRCFRDLI
jgi:hypothetical protein